MATAVIFLNYSDEDFTGKWDGIEYSIPAGESRMFEDWKAAHFAKHLVNRELQRMGEEVTSQYRKEQMSRALPKEDKIEAEDESKLNDEIRNKTHPCSECDFVAKSAAGLKRHMKTHKKEEEFEGIK